MEIGVFAPAASGEPLGAPLYVRKHRIRSGRQTVTVTVPRKSARAGIDPYNLLDWEEGDNIEPVEIRSPERPARLTLWLECQAPTPPGRCRLVRERRPHGQVPPPG